MGPGYILKLSRHHYQGDFFVDTKDPYFSFSNQSCFLHRRALASILKLLHRHYQGEFLFGAKEPCISSYISHGRGLTSIMKLSRRHYQGEFLYGHKRDLFFGLYFPRKSPAFSAKEPCNVHLYLHVYI